MYGTAASTAVTPTAAIVPARRAGRAVPERGFGEAADDRSGVTRTGA